MSYWCGKIRLIGQVYKEIETEKAEEPELLKIEGGSLSGNNSEVVA